MGATPVATRDRATFDSVLDQAAAETMPAPERLSTDLSTIYPRDVDLVLPNEVDDVDFAGLMEAGIDEIVNASPEGLSTADIYDEIVKHRSEV